MASMDDSDVPETGAVFTFGRSRFADNLANKFWIRNDKIVQVACGDEHSIVVTDRGRLYAFGTNDWGQLGLGHTKNSNKPSFIKTLKTDKMVSVACGRTHTVAASADGKIYSFGAGGDGQLGHGDTEDQVSPKQIAGLPVEKVKMISCGVYHSAVLFESGDLYIWGTSGDGQTGHEEEEVFRPMSLKFDDPVSWVACGYYHTAVVTESGKLYTFGENENGKLGLSESQLSDTSRPQPVATKDGYFTAVACGAGHTIALTKDGKVFSFGDGSRGQLGQGTRVQELKEPNAIQQLNHLKAKYVSCGDCHTAVITENGRLYTFGDGRHGKLGQGEECFSNQFRPVKVARFENFMVESVSCGGCHTLVTAVLRDPEMSDEEEDAEDGVLNASLMSSYSHASIDEANATMRPFGLANTMPLISPRDKRRKKESENLANSFSGGIGQFHKSGSLSLDRSRLPQIPKLRDMKETKKLENKDVKREEMSSKEPPVTSKTEKDVVEEQNKKNSQKDVDEMKRRIEDELDDEEAERTKAKKEKEKGKAKEEEEESEEEESGEEDDETEEESEDEEEEDETKEEEGKKKGVITKEKEQQKQQIAKTQAKQEEEEESEEESEEEEGSEEEETDEETEEDDEEEETAVKSKDKAKADKLVKFEKEDAVKKKDSEKMVKKTVAKKEEETDDDDEDDEDKEDDEDDDDEDEDDEEDDESEEEEEEVKGKKDKDSDSKKETSSKKEVKIKEDSVEEETKSSKKEKGKDKKEKDKKGKDKQSKDKKIKGNKEGGDEGEGSGDKNEEDAEKELNNNDDEIKDGNKEEKVEETQPPKKSKFGNLFGGKKKQAPPPKVEQTATEQTAKDEVDGPVKVTEPKKSGKSGVCVIL